MCGWRPGEVQHGKAEPRVATTWPPTSARGCAGSACDDPITSTIEVANGMMTGSAM
jgi:hypothetical protein